MDNVEQIVQEAMQRAGEKHDQHIQQELSSLSREELLHLLQETRETQEYRTKGEKNGLLNLSAKRSQRSGTSMSIIHLLYQNKIVRNIAAVGLVVILLVGAYFIPFTYENPTANLLQKTNTAIVIYPYDTKGKVTTNAKGAPNTEAILNRASKNISKSNRLSVRNGVHDLEQLLKNDYRKKSLDVHTHWYLALGYLKQGHKEKAIQELQIVTHSSQQPYASQAAKLLQELQNLQ